MCQHKLRLSVPFKDVGKEDQFEEKALQLLKVLNPWLPVARWRVLRTCSFRFDEESSKASG